MRRFILFVCVVAICVFGLYRWTEEQGPERVPEKFTPAEGPKLGDQDVHVLEAADSEYTALVQAVVPSVVSITATKRIEAPEVVDPFELFFGGRFHHPRRTEEMRSLGSGVIVSKEGHIITNQHVVADVDEVSVRLSNGQEAPARVIGSDAITDIAVLKVTGIKVTPLAFADSDTIKVGQRVIAVGNPFGFDETVTQGIISAKGRAMEDSANDFFQTDAAINPGNSGGPLVDIHGEIVGINSWIISNSSGSGSWQGLGFAIPANTAKRALEAIIKTGHVPHGYLGVVPGAQSNNPSPPADDLPSDGANGLLAGVHVMEIPPDHEQDLPAHAHGVMVTSVDDNCPATGTLQQSDVIEAIDHVPIHSVAEYQAAASALPGGKALISICRDRRRSFTVVTAQ